MFTREFLESFEGKKVALVSGGYPQAGTLLKVYIDYISMMADYNYIKYVTMDSIVSIWELAVPGGPTGPCGPTGAMGGPLGPPGYSG